MAYGGGSSLRGGALARRNSHRKNRFLRVSVIGLLAGGFACAAIAAVAVSAGRIVAVSLDLRPDTRSIAASAPPAVRQAWAARPPIDRAAQMVIIASLS